MMLFKLGNLFAIVFVYYWFIIFLQIFLFFFKVAFISCLNKLN